MIADLIEILKWICKYIKNIFGISVKIPIYTEDILALGDPQPIQCFPIAVLDEFLGQYTQTYQTKEFSDYDTLEKNSIVHTEVGFFILPEGTKLTALWSKLQIDQDNSSHMTSDNRAVKTNITRSSLIHDSYCFTDIENNSKEKSEVEDINICNKNDELKITEKINLDLNEDVNKTLSRENQEISGLPSKLSEGGNNSNEFDISLSPASHKPKLSSMSLSLQFTKNLSTVSTVPKQHQINLVSNKNTNSNYVTVFEKIWTTHESSLGCTIAHQLAAALDTSITNVRLDRCYIQSEDEIELTLWEVNALKHLAELFEINADTIAARSFEPLHISQAAIVLEGNLLQYQHAKSVFPACLEVRKFPPGMILINPGVISATDVAFISVFHPALIDTARQIISSCRKGAGKWYEVGKCRIVNEKPDLNLVTELKDIVFHGDPSADITRSSPALDMINTANRPAQTLGGYLYPEEYKLRGLRVSEYPVISKGYQKSIVQVSEDITNKTVDAISCHQCLPRGVFAVSLDIRGLLESKTVTKKILQRLSMEHNRFWTVAYKKIANLRQDESDITISEKSLEACVDLSNNSVSIPQQLANKTLELRKNKSNVKRIFEFTEAHLHARITIPLALTVQIMQPDLLISHLHTAIQPSEDTILGVFSDPIIRVNVWILECNPTVLSHVCSLLFYLAELAWSSSKEILQVSCDPLDYRFAADALFIFGSSSAIQLFNTPVKNCSPESYDKYISKQKNFVFNYSETENIGMLVRSDDILGEDSKYRATKTLREAFCKSSILAGEAIDRILKDVVLIHRANNFLQEEVLMLSHELIHDDPGIIRQISQFVPVRYIVINENMKPCKQWINLI